MKKIRTRVLETNSSSSHVLAIEELAFVLDSIIPDDQGVVMIKSGEFGWEWRKYNDAETKASYCLTATQYTSYPDALSNLHDVILEHSLANQVILGKADEGYIDHESTWLVETILQDKQQLKNFIFNKKCWLFTGNDNSSAPHGFYETEPVTYRYQLDFPDYPQFTWKFKEKPTKDEMHEAINDLGIYFEKINGEFVLDESYGDYCVIKAVSNSHITFGNWESKLHPDTFQLAYTLKEI